MGPTAAGLPFSFVMRIYQPTNLTDETWNIQLASAVMQTGVSIVTALEEVITETATTVTCPASEIQVTNMPTLATIWVQAVGTNVPSTSGKG